MADYVEIYNSLKVKYNFPVVSGSLLLRTGYDIVKIEYTKEHMEFLINRRLSAIKSKCNLGRIQYYVTSDNMHNFFFSFAEPLFNLSKLFKTDQIKNNTVFILSEKIKPEQRIFSFEISEDIAQKKIHCIENFKNENFDIMDFLDGNLIDNERFWE
jgi:hypothetical protein